jgi:hypothetical protein
MNFSILGKAKDFSLQSIQTHYGTYPASSVVHTGSKGARA